MGVERIVSRAALASDYRLEAIGSKRVFCFQAPNHAQVTDLYRFFVFVPTEVGSTEVAFPMCATTVNYEERYLPFPIFIFF
jgi:hypothetical protein